MEKIINDPIRVVIEQFPETDFSIHTYLPSIVAAIVGVIIAFIGWKIQKNLLDKQLQQLKETERNREKENNFMALNNSLFTIFCQWDSILRIKPTLIKYKGDNEGWHKIPLFHQNEEVTPRHDVKTLAPILLSNEPEVLSDLFLVQKNFESYFLAIERRNKKRRVLNDLIIAKKPTTHVEVELKALTDHLYTGYDTLVEAFKNSRSQLKSIAKKKFPDRKTIQYTMKDEEGISSIKPF